VDTVENHLVLLFRVKVVVEWGGWGKSKGQGMVKDGDEDVSMRDGLATGFCTKTPHALGRAGEAMQVFLFPSPLLGGWLYLHFFQII
jgi:hypothetical protein